MTVWAFNGCNENKEKGLLLGSLKAGKSRFGWSQDENHNLLIKNNWTDWHSRQLFLLEIKEDDWIVHINVPTWGRCVAAKVVSRYGFDEGLECSWGTDFRHFFSIDIESIIEFERRDPNVLPTVNLNPRYRYHRIHAQEDFYTSINNIKSNKVNLSEGENKEEYHLKQSTYSYLKELTVLIQSMNKSKNLERFLAKVFRKMPNVIDVEENGFGWGTDYGADLIVTVKSQLVLSDMETKMIIQIKSYSGDHTELSAIDQIRTGLEKYNGDIGLLITTGEKTESLEKKAMEVSDNIGYPIDILSGDDVARFVIKYAPDLIFDMGVLA